MFAALFAALALAGAATPPAAPHASYQLLTTANGFTAAIYDVEAAKLVSFREHAFRDLAEMQPVRDLAGEVRFGLRVGGQARWLNEVGAASARYLPGSGIIESVQRFGTVEATSYYFAPYEAPTPAATATLLLLRVRNLGPRPLSSTDAAFSFQDLRLADRKAGAVKPGESIGWDAQRGLLLQRHANGHALILTPLAPPSGVALAPSDPLALVTAGTGFPAELPLAVAPSRPGAAGAALPPSGFQWSLADLAPGEARWTGLAAVFSAKGEKAALAPLQGWLEGRSAEQLLKDELAGWERWHQKSQEPARLSEDERAVYRQQLAILRMGQVREPNDPSANYLPHGQMLACLPPGKWNIAWVRDGTVALRALVRAGHHAEARDGLAFFLNAKAGFYVCCDKSGSSYVPKPYRISVNRYFGNGTEESNFNADGANIEWDAFGMFLDALDVYEEASKDATLADAHWKAVTEGVADVLVALVGADGLLPADSSIWETHWENGARQRWTWSHLYGVRGLRAASAMAARRGQTARAELYSKTADRLLAGLQEHMIDASGFLRGRAESTPVPEDASVAEAFVLGLLPGDGPVAKATLARLHQKLLVPAGHGYRRNLGPSEYDSREWIFIDLMMAGAWRRAGRPDNADALVGWVTDQARHNYNLVAENFHPSSADYAGEVPMIGFGAGAYVLALFDRQTLVRGDASSGRPSDWTPSGACRGGPAADRREGPSEAAERPGRPSRELAPELAL